MDRPVTLITGTSRGIGRHLACHYLSRGHIVYGCSRGDSTVSDDRYRHFSCDVRDENAVLPIFAAIRKQEGCLLNLVNNAGIGLMNHALLTPLPSIRDIFCIHFEAAFLFSREAAKIMMRKRYGRIVNFGSVAAPLRLEGEAAYASAKSAVITLTGVLARELADFGITVNCVSPGPIDTDLTRNVPREKLDEIIARQAIHRYGSFEDVANVVDFFLQPESGFITGQNLCLGGIQ